MRKSATLLIHLLIAICFVLPSFAEALESACEPTCAFSAASHGESGCLEASSESSSHSSGTSSHACDCFLHHHCVSHFTTVPATAKFARAPSSLAKTLPFLLAEASPSAFLAAPFQPPRN